MSVDIGKVIGKTALKTTIIVIIVLALGLAGFAGIFPGTLSDVGDRMGSSYFAVVFSERQYNRSGDINDLGTLVERAIKYQDRDVTIRYSKELLGFEANGKNIFDQYAAFQDDRMSAFLNREYSYDDYINGNLAAALWQNKPQEAILYAGCGKFFVTKNRYGDNNSFTYAVSAFLEYQTGTGLNLLTGELEKRGKLEEMERYLAECREAAAAEGAGREQQLALEKAVSELKSLYSDLYRIYASRVGDAEKAAHYHELYSQLSAS